MGKTYDGIDDDLAGWLMRQPLWFVGTAPLSPNGHINVSPRGHDTLSVLDRHRVAWVDLTGSGVETIAHVRENARICLMFCSFGERPRIVRLHGRASVAASGEAIFDVVVRQHPAHPSTRAVVVVDVERVSDSCGFGVPVMEVVGERDLLRLSADKRGPVGLAAYRSERNAISIDGLPGFPP
ncbi:MAG: pyridoxamine 5'-phosphate oxidase family protein [Mycobacteriales bacterium]